MSNFKSWILSASALTAGLVAATGAFAQSSGTQASEEVVVTAKKVKTISGTIVAETVAKARSTVTQQALAELVPGQTIGEALNVIPGVNFTNNDPYGLIGGDLRIHGFDNSRLALMLDGMPLNDTGNYALYWNELVVPELLGSVTVNTGATDVDSPTASATGGTVNMQTIKPTQTAETKVVGSVGSFDEKRIFAQVNTGAFGPWGTTAWVAIADQTADQWQNSDANQHRTDFDGRLYQDFGGGSFGSLMFHYTRDRIYNQYAPDGAYSNGNGTTITSASSNYVFHQAEFNQYGYSYAPYAIGCNNSSISGSADNKLASGAYQTNSCTNFQGRQINPSNTGNIHGQFKWVASPAWTFTFDPSWQYVLADGGSQISSYSDKDGRLVGALYPATKAACTASATCGVSLAQDGSLADTVAVFNPSVTNTHRYGFTSSAIWDLDAHNRLRVAFTYDYGRHRQTGQDTLLNADGTAPNPFGGKLEPGLRIYGDDGSIFYNRNRASVAQLEQFAAEYRGLFLDDKLALNIGVRAPDFTRELHQFCYTQIPAPGKSAGSVYCTTETPTTVTGQPLEAQFVSQGSNLYVRPFSMTKSYHEALPTVGLKYQIDAQQSVFTDYAESTQVPGTDELYSVVIANGQITSGNIVPETSKTGELGYRFQSGDIIAQTAAWVTQFNNRLISTYDPATNLTDYRNVGTVNMHGIDGEIDYSPIKTLHLTTSVTWETSSLASNLAESGGLFLPTKGKELVETPDWMFVEHVRWDINKDWMISGQAKYVGDRYATDVNDEKAPGYWVVNVNGRWYTPWDNRRSYFQLNVNNLFSAKYLASINSTNTAFGAAGVSGSAPYYTIGAPRTVVLSYIAKF